MNKTKEELNKEVEDWWNSNPFSFGIGSKKGDQVGGVPLADMDIKYFNEIDRRFRKHTEGGAQSGKEPLFTKLIDYEELVKNKRVLDIAVGSGFSLVEYVRQGAKEITGIDLTEFGVQEAKKNLSLRNMRAEVIKMDAQKLRFRDDTFDFVSAWGCYMHMPDTEGAISETYRVLKSGGTAFAYMYNKDSWPFWFNTILIKGIFMGKLFKYKFNITKLTSRYADGSSDGGNPLTRFYSKRAIKKIYNAAGFKNVTVRPLRIPDEPNHWPFRRFPIFKWILPRKIKDRMTKWSYGLIVIGEK